MNFHAKMEYASLILSRVMKYPNFLLFIISFLCVTGCFIAY